MAPQKKALSTDGWFLNATLKEVLQIQKSVGTECENCLLENSFNRPV